MRMQKRVSGGRDICHAIILTIWEAQAQEGKYEPGTDTRNEVAKSLIDRKPHCYHVKPSSNVRR